MSSNITLPTTSVQITSQNIPLLASQSHESIFPTPVSATVELIHSVSVYLFHKVTNSRCQRLIRKANSCKIAKSQHSCAELLWETSQLKKKAFCLQNQCQGNGKTCSAVHTDQRTVAFAHQQH